MQQWWAVMFLVGLALPACGGSQMGTPPPATGAPALSLQRVFADVALDQPLAMVQRPHNDDFFYVVERRGRVVRIPKDGGGAGASEFVDLRDRVESGPTEAGLLGMAFDPRFDENGWVYLSYTRVGLPLVSVLSRFRSRDDGLTLDPSSEQVLLTVDQPYENHNGGEIAFGPQHYLYFGLGDGGFMGDPKGNAQNTNSLLGKLLRLDVSGGGAYRIPVSNPFANGGGRPEIYAWGFRNPWRWSFDRLSGELWLGDVGQNDWEEVDRVVIGGNYGWNLREGFHCYTGDCNKVGLLDPVLEYSHDEGCSITGGYVYRGQAIPALRGYYLYGDYCSGKIWGMYSQTVQYQGHLLLDTDLRISSFAEANDGELYVLDLKGGIYRLTGGEVPAPKP
jgi:glucose/arabinose dehydrogenase